MRRGTRPVVFRERAGFQSNARLGGARSTGNLRVRGAWRGASSSEGGFSGVGGPFPGRFRGRAEREGEGLRVQMSASRRLRATFPHDSAVSREPGSIRMSSGPFSPGGVVRGSGLTCWRAGSTCWRGWAGAGWCGWGFWGGPGRGRVRICCKGAPGRDRRREEARNINVSLPTFRRDRGLCNRFGQTTPSRAPARTAVPAIAPTPGPTRPGPRLPVRRLYTTPGLVRTGSRSRVVSHADPSGPVGGVDPGPARDRSCPAAKEGRP